MPFDSESSAFFASAPKAGAPETLIVVTSVPGNDLPRAQSNIRSTDVFLPAGTCVNFAALAKIVPCTDAQLAVNSAAPATCPAASQVGVAVLVSPLVGTTVGKVYFGAATPTAPLRQFITAQITPTQTAKFIAINTLTPNLVIRATLTNLPQTPVTTFALGFPGGPNGLLTAPATCGVHYGVGVFSGWKGGAAIGPARRADRDEHDYRRAVPGRRDAAELLAPAVRDSRPRARERRAWHSAQEGPHADEPRVAEAGQADGQPRLTSIPRRRRLGAAAAPSRPRTRAGSAA